jgi:DNA-binding NtrC family response regulator
MSHRILVIDDEKSILDTLEILLRGEGFEVALRTKGAEAIEEWEAIDPDIVLTDIRMPGVSGMDVLTAVREKDPEVPVILMTAQASLQSAIEAVNQGAFYYLQKPFSNDNLVALCRRAGETRVLKRENVRLKKEIKRRDTSRAARPVGRNRAFEEVLELAETVAPTDSTVLITGESGTGKEVLARYIHSLSDRDDGPFISVNCGALPESLLESELFGHVRGAFTGAVKDKDGLLVAARGGTFFLDEIGEMSPALQVKLLRVLESGEVRPVGDTGTRPVDVRLVSATNRDLEAAVEQGDFRRDLFYRINTVEIQIPPLRRRRVDIPFLAQHFAEEFGVAHARRITLDEDFIATLGRFDFPGNVRELRNAVERAIALADPEGPVTSQHLVSASGQALEIPLPRDGSLRDRLAQVEAEMIREALERCDWNRSRAARSLGLSRQGLRYKMRRVGLEPESA